MTKEKTILPGMVKDLEAATRHSPPARHYDAQASVATRRLRLALSMALKRLARLGCFQTMDEIAGCGPEVAAMVKEARG